MRKLVILLAALFASFAATAQPLWMRYCAISPDGQKIAFTYKGDIYTVDVNGGQAKQITTSASYDNNPIWSNDSKTIAYMTDVNGNFDIYTISANGGISKRITTNSVSEKPLAFSPDDKFIYYSAAIQDPAPNVQYPTNMSKEVYKTSIDGGRPMLVVASPACNISFATDNQSFVYYNVTSFENEWRKHHVSSAARDIVYFDANTQTHRILTTNPGEDRDPNFISNNKIVFLSERNGGTFNVYEGEMDNLDNAKPITNFKNHPIRFLSAAKNGTLCFGYMGEIFTKIDGKEPVKLAISIVNDLPQEQIITTRLTSGDDFAMTPNGDQIAIITRGEVFVTTDEFATTKQITKTAEAEYSISFSPDGKTIAYASERSGIWNIYTATKARSEEINFANSTIIDEKPLFSDSNIERFAPAYSPDGKELAFVENRNILKVINLETKAVRQITDGKQNYDNDFGLEYQWSPDGKWFVVSITTNRHWPYNDVAIVSSNGDMVMHNITNSGYSDGMPTWALDGNAVIFMSDRLGMRSHASWGSQEDVFIAFMNQDAMDKFNMSEEEYKLLKEEEKLAKKDAKSGDTNEAKDKKKKDKDAKADKSDEKSKEVKPITIEFEGLEDRVQRLTPMSSRLGSAVLSNDGEKLYYLSSFEKGFDLWETKIRERSTKLLKKLNGRYATLKLDKKGENLFIFASRDIKKIPVKGGETKNITFDAKAQINLTKEREYMFNHVFLQEQKRFYTTSYHGVNLEQLKADYKPFLQHINNNYDFAEMLSEVLGELNVSHTGSGYRPSLGGDVTAQLGAFYDWSFTGNGLRIDEIIESGPFDNRRSKAKKGDIIEKIDGVEIVAQMDYFPLLNNKVGTKTLISLYDPQTKQRWDEVVKPISTSAQNELLYQRWVKHNAEQVTKLSGGKLGYVHIRSMGDASYRDVYSDILGKYNLCQGIVIDTRFNGGGRLHEDIEILFSGEKYLEQVIQDVVICDMPSRRYNKPSIMIIGEANYSNAHGTPWVYKYKKMGKLVGMPVAGTMTSVNWETLQDPSLHFGIPVCGYRTRDGKYLENSQIEPDIKVRNTPEKLVQGIDEQLEAAVKELLKEVDTANLW